MLSNSNANHGSIGPSPAKSSGLAPLRIIIEKRLLSPLASPISYPLTDGFYAQDLKHAASVFTKFSRLFGESREGAQCERMIHAQIDATGGDFLLSLEPGLCSHTPFDPRNPTVEMRPLGSLGWRIRIGDGCYQAEVCARIGTKALKIAERLAYPIVPIPGLEGAAGFDSAAAALALRSSPLGLSELASSSPRELLLSNGEERLLLSCSMGFWVDGDFLYSDGHHAFARRHFPVRLQYREQLFIDLSSLEEDGSKSPYIHSPSTYLMRTIGAVRTIMQDNFSPRSSLRKTCVSELLESSQ